MSFSNISLDRRQFLKVSGALLAAPTLAGLAGCGSGSSSSGTAAGSASGSSSGSASKFSGDFIIGFDQEFPPYGYLDDNGNPTGFDLDLAKLVCDAKGWNYKPTPISWDAKDAMLNSGQITCIWNGFTIEGRENAYAFTDPYMENRQVVVVKSGSGITALSDLAGKTVITQADSAAYDLLNTDGAQAELGASFGALKTIADYNTAFMMLENGSCDAVAVDYPVAKYNISGKENVYTILDEALNSEHFGVGFAKTDQGAALAKEVESELQKLDSDGKVKEVCDKYADQGVSYDLWCLPKA